MSTECSDKDWIIELGVRPHQMSPIDPPVTELIENDSRLFSSIYCLTLAEKYSSHRMDSYLLEHIQMEKEYSEQDDLTVVWSDEVSLTLCFLASLAHHGNYSEDHLLQRYFQWWMNGYMCPTGLCFTPHVHLKKSIDLFGETQAAQALGLEVDLSKKTAILFPTPSSVLRLSPVAYFFGKHSSSKRLEMIKNCVGRMFGKHTSIDVFVQYVELLVNALNGISKEEIIQNIQLKSNSNDSLSQIFVDLIDLLSNDQNNIDKGIEIALTKQQQIEEECQYLNPFDSDRTILLTLYLQLTGAISNSIPTNFSDEIYGQKTIECLIKWIIYQRNENLRSIE